MAWRGAAEIVQHTSNDKTQLLDRNSELLNLAPFCRSLFLNRMLFRGAALIDRRMLDPVALVSRQLVSNDMSTPDDFLVLIFTVFSYTETEKVARVLK